MNKTQIIKKTVGEKLKAYGFRYLKTDGTCRIFVREAHGYKRYYDPGDRCGELVGAKWFFEENL